LRLRAPSNASDHILSTPATSAAADLALQRTDYLADKLLASRQAQREQLLALALHLTPFLQRTAQRTTGHFGSFANKIPFALRKKTAVFRGDAGAYLGYEKQ
jgi:hypothetical protein